MKIDFCENSSAAMSKKILVLLITLNVFALTGLVFALMFISNICNDLTVANKYFRENADKKRMAVMHESNIETLRTKTLECIDVFCSDSEVNGYRMIKNGILVLGLCQIFIIFLFIFHLWSCLKVRFPNSIPIDS